VALAVALLAAGCTRGSTSSRPPIHLNPNMDDQPRYEAQAASEFFADGMAMRQPVPGTVARGRLDEDPVLTTGRGPGGALIGRNPLRVDDELLERGAERYAIYCGPCHGDDGSGQSILRERYGVATADLNQARLRAEGDGYLYDVIANGFGLMPSYRYPVPARDRWAIVAHVRRLQAEAGAPSEGGAGGADADIPETIEVEAPAEATAGAAPAPQPEPAAPAPGAGPSGGGPP
jgi:mono/diheme cytochrome c family protein